MLDSAKRALQINKEEFSPERRKSSDRRVSSEETRFPFIDDNKRLVMKDRRSEDRRSTDTKFKSNPIKKVSQLLKK